MESGEGMRFSVGGVVGFEAGGEWLACRSYERLREGETEIGARAWTNHANELEEIAFGNRVPATVSQWRQEGISGRRKMCRST